ncbi:MAG: peptidylprolyl isomerase [Rhodoferax sp.]|nr:peptidylprolyl isomerase [Rhodoferax sp.]
MKKHILSTLALNTGMVVAVVSSSAAFAQNLAVVNGVAVPKDRLEIVSQQYARSGRPVTPEMQTQLRDEVIAREVFAQEAHKQGLDATDDYKNQLELMKQSILIRELFNDYQKKNPVTDEEAKAEYDKFTATNSGKEYKARHILVAKEAEAKDIIAKIKKGAKFEDLAKKLSKDPGSGAKGGDLDWANPGNYVKEFSAALTSLQKGKMTETPVKSQFGYHIIRLDDVRDAQLPKFEDIKPQISQQLLQQKMARYQEELRAKAKIE